jgi:serine/threonine-protein kinase
LPGDITGRKVLNRYKIVEKIGGGGMSVVWKAYDLVLDRSVALKILRPEMSEDEDFVRRFKREAQSVASLSHPNIVNIYDVGEDCGLYFIVMELIGEGETLRDRLKVERRLAVPDALDVASQICEALSHAHARRIIHRDIKPQNILLTEEGHVRVADFGIARALGGISTTSTDTVVGSAPYISPEQARNGMVSTRSDLYSLGVVIYEMLSGKPPFGGDNPVAVALQHVEADAPSLRENYPSIPQAVDDLVKKAMAKDPDARFQTAEEVLEAIRAVQAGKLPAPTRERSRDEAEVAAGDGEMVKGKRRPVQLPLSVKILIGMAVLAIAAAGYTAYLFNTWWSVPIVEVPDVVGKGQVEAQAILKETGLVFQISGERYDSKVPAGTVLSQSPQGGEKAKRNREIYCLLSKGQDFAKVPDVVGKIYPREVIVLLQNAGVQVGNVTTAPHPTIGKDKVISQNPRPGLDMPKDTPVDLIISMGPESQTVKVPKVVGLFLNTARSALNAALLDVGLVGYDRNAQAAQGTVVSQDPAPDAVAEIRSKINLVVAGGPPSPTHSYTKRFTVGRDLSPSGNPIRVRIWVIDASGEILVYDRAVAPDDPPQSVSFEWQGTQATLKMDMGGRVTTETIRP